MNWLFPLLSLGTSIFGGTRSAGGYDVSRINRIIEEYRKKGLADIAESGRTAKGEATSRLAASGFAPTLGLQQAAFNPILNQLVGARANLEGQLGQMRAQLMGQMQRQDLAEFENLTNMLAGLSDLFGTAALRGDNEFDFFPDFDYLFSTLEPNLNQNDYIMNPYGNNGIGA